MNAMIVNDTTHLTPRPPLHGSTNGVEQAGERENTTLSGEAKRFGTIEKPSMSPSGTEGVAERRGRSRGRSGTGFMSVLCLILIAALFCAPACAAIDLTCDSLSITIDDATGRITTAWLPDHPDLLPLTGGLRLTEGVEAREIDLTGVAVTPGEPVTLRYAPEGEALEIEAAVAATGGHFAWEVTLRNTGERQRLLALSLPVEVPGDGPIAAYDGFLPTEALTEAFDGPMYRTPIPLCAAWSTEGGAATGINPREHLSFIATSGEPLEGGGARVATRTHLVLDPDQELSVELFLCGMTGEWGRGEALHWWYESAPELFAPTPGIDPRILNASGQYLAWKRNPLQSEDYQVREVARRTRTGWDWCINPFKRAGEIVVREEWYDYTPANPELLAEEDRVSWAEYRARRQEQFAAGERLGVAMLLYTPSQIWLEEQLAREQFADALVVDPSHTTRYPRGYVKPQDSVVRVFPYNTSWGEQSRRDLAEVAEQLGLYGFSFDTATGPAKFRGAAIDGLPERGWDENGPFVREGVAIRRLMEHVHTLRHADGTTLGVVANIRSSADYNSCIGSDAALYEGEPWKGMRGSEWALRDAIGTKPACWWEHYALDSFVDYRNMTRDEIAAAYQGLADFMCIESLHMGFWPTAAFARGFESMTDRYLPRIEACIGAGPRPVAAARSDDFTWLTRYGSGLNTHVAIGNETAAPATGTLTLSRGWLDEPWPVRTVALLAEIPIIGRLFQQPGALAFTGFDGDELTTQMAEDELTVTGVAVPTRSADVVTACAALRLPATPGGSSISAAWTGDRTRRALTLQVRASREIEPAGAVRIPPRMRVAEVRVDGEPVTCHTRDGMAFFGAAGERAEFRAEVEFVSAIIEPPQERLLEVEFLFEDTPAGFIVIPAQPTWAEEIAAERIVHYFQWFLHSERDVAEPPAFPVVRGEIPRDDSLMIVINRERAEEPTVALPDMRHLSISAPDAAGLQAAVDELLRVLDVTYVAPPTFVWRRSTNQAGLIGEWLPDPVAAQ